MQRESPSKQKEGEKAMSNIEKQAELATNIKLSFRQRIDYSISEFGYNSIYYWISAFMAVFLTDQMGIAAGAVSFLTLFVRIFDGINDPIIGPWPTARSIRAKASTSLGCAGVRWPCPFPSSPCSPCSLPGATPSS